jgi:hypothetical protein
MNDGVMSVLGHEPKCQPRSVASALPPKADIPSRLGNVGFVPILLQKSEIVVGATSSINETVSDHPPPRRRGGIDQRIVHCLV